MLRTFKLFLFNIMKTCNYSVVSASLLLLSLAVIACKKNSERLNISLHDKPLAVIQSYVQGSWKLHHEEGGFCGPCIFYPKDSTFNLYLTLTPERIILRNAARVTVDTTTNWVYANISGDKTFIMNFRDRSGAPIVLGAREIVNDTLVIYQPGPDGLYFYYVKTN